MKIGKIELSDWQPHASGWCRYEMEGFYHGKIVVMLHLSHSYDLRNTHISVDHIRFYEPLYFCNPLYHIENKTPNMKVTAAQEDVDNFLRKIDRLMAFA